MVSQAASHVLPTYARVDLAFERGEGAWLTATNGDRYLDFTSGVAVNALGHAHPHLVAALTEQAQKLWHVSNLYRIPQGERLAARLDVARGNLEAHAAGYSLSQVQDLYLDLSELRADVERLALEWEALRAEALAALRTVAATIEDNAERPIAEADPGTVLDVDHWTDGGLAALRDAVARQVDLVADPDCPLDAAELRALITETAPEHEGRLDALVERAAERIVASQLRVNVAEQVVAVLEGQGFAWSGNTYAAGDERRAFFSRLRHRADGGEVVVEVAPDGDGSGFTLRILSYEDDPDDAARRERSAAVSRALRAEGLDAGDPAEEGGEPDPALRDFDRLARPTAKQIVTRAKGVQH